MTKRISCADVGSECKWSARAETEEDLMDMVAEHVKEDHKDIKMTPKAVANIKAHIIHS